MELKEIFDARKLKLIIDNWEFIQFQEGNDKYDPIQICKKYLEESKQIKSDSNINIINVEYTQKSNGRLYANYGLSLQSLPRIIRNTISNDFYYDIDIANCFPTLLNQWLKKNKFNYEKLDYFEYNRDSIFKKLQQESNRDKDYYIKRFYYCIKWRY